MPKDDIFRARGEGGGGEGVIYTSFGYRFIGRMYGNGLNWRRTFIRPSVLALEVSGVAITPIIGCSFVLESGI